MHAVSTEEEALVLLRNKWTSGYYQDFIKLIANVRKCSQEDAERLFRKWLDKDGLLGFNGDGWLVWVRGNPVHRLIKCPKCGAETPEAAAFCRECGWRLPTSYG